MKKRYLFNLLIVLLLSGLIIYISTGLIGAKSISLYAIHDKSGWISFPSVSKSKNLGEDLMFGW